MPLKQDSITIEKLADLKSLALQRTYLDTAATTIELSVDSSAQYIFGGSTEGQVVKLPDSTTLTPGWFYKIWNTSTESIQIVDQGDNELIIVYPKDDAEMTLDDNGTVNGVWAISKKNIVSPAEIDFRLLSHEPTGFENLTDSVISFDNVLRRFTISPAVDEFIYFIDGIKYEKTATETVDIMDIDGSWFVYYVEDVLTVSQTPWQFGDSQAFVAYVYWCTTSQDAILFAEERHGLVMDWATHKRLHLVKGLEIESPEIGFKLGDTYLRGDGSLDSHATFSVGEGVVHDEDLRHILVDSATPTGRYEQTLSSIANIPMYYLEGNPAKWKKVDAGDFALIYDGVNPVKFNYQDPGTGVWSLQNAVDGQFVNTFLLVTNNINEPVIGVVGRESDENIEQAFNEDHNNILASLGGFTHEVQPLYRLVFLTKTAYTNTPKAILYTWKSFLVDEGLDRYTFEASLAGNAIINKYLDIFNGIESVEVPFVFPEVSFVRTVTINTSALNTGVMGFYLLPDTTNPVFTIALNNENYKRQNYSHFFEPDQRLAVKVFSGAFNKPAVRVWIQTQQ